MLLVDSCYSGIWVHKARALRVRNLAVQSSVGKTQISSGDFSLLQSYHQHNYKAHECLTGADAKGRSEVALCDSYVSWMEPANIYTLPLGPQHFIEFFDATPSKSQIRRVPAAPQNTTDAQASRTRASKSSKDADRPRAAQHPYLLAVILLLLGVIIGVLVSRRL
jgi:hypothetical protein